MAAPGVVAGLEDDITAEKRIITIIKQKNYHLSKEV